MMLHNTALLKITEKKVAQNKTTAPTMPAHFWGCEFVFWLNTKNSQTENAVIAKKRIKKVYFPKKRAETIKATSTNPVMLRVIIGFNVV